MFNTTIHQHESKVVAVTKEIEKTISPDKVTEMYGAVKEEVLNTIIRSYVISSNVLSGVIMINDTNYSTAEKEYCLRFSLNGDEHIHKGKLPVEMIDNHSAIYDKVFDIYKSAVADSLMRETIGLFLVPQGQDK